MTMLALHKGPRERAILPEPVSKAQFSPIIWESLAADVPRAPRRCEPCTPWVKAKDEA